MMDTIKLIEGFRVFTKKAGKGGTPFPVGSSRSLRRKSFSVSMATGIFLLEALCQ